MHTHTDGRPVLEFANTNTYGETDTVTEVRVPTTDGAAYVMVHVRPVRGWTYWEEPPARTVAQQVDAALAGTGYRRIRRRETVPSSSLRFVYRYHVTD